MKLLKKNKKRTIRSQILIPFLAIMVALPFSVLITFNIAMSYYSSNMAKKELMNTMKTVTSLMQNDIENDFNDKKNDRLGNTLRTLAYALTATKLSGNTDFFLLKDDKVVYPYDLSDTLMTKKLMESIFEDKIKANDGIYKRRVDGINYYLLATNISGFDKMPTVTMLFISNGSTADQLLRSINIIITTLIMIFIVISTSFYLGVTNKISKPITKIAHLAREIGRGEFVDVPIINSYNEIYQLTFSINDMSTRLKKSDRIQKQFLQNASHELRTPLMSIQGYAEGIENDIIDKNSAARIIKNESIRMNKLVDELLTLSRLENQTYKIRLENINLSELLNDFVDSVNGFAMQKGIEIVSNIKPEVVLESDESLLAQIIINILSNCIRYASNRVSINMSDDNGVIIVIRDDGEGFEDIDIAHIFDRFYKGKGGNFGLGLSIAKSATEYLNGSIIARNNGGAEFLIRL